MPKLYLKENQTLLGEISDEQLQFLRNQLEEESIDDQDYAITPMLLAFFEGQNCDPNLLAILRKALGDAEEMTIFWEEQ